MTRPRVVVVGLGPAGPELITAAARHAIDRSAVRVLRTARHPAASAVPDAITCDDLYEQADRFEQVYEAIATRLHALAAEHGEVVYAVPGSPLVLERSVRHLIDDDRLEVTVVPGLSFLDLAYGTLGIDPIEAGVRLVDGHTFAVSAAGERGPLLVAHVHARHVLTDIKLAVDDGDPDTEVVVLQRLGLPDEHVQRVRWADLDREVEPDHLTCLYIARVAAPVGQELVRFHDLARVLRERCPWDQEQTHQSLIRYLLEEAYEVVDAIQALDPDDPATDEELIEELGDLLYQVEFHATIAEQEGRFSMADVARGIHDKLVRRHPHVFGDVEVEGTHEVLRNWEAIKQEEKGRTSVFEGIPSSLPALAYALKAQKKAAGLGFDAPDVSYFVPKVREELQEVLDAGDHHDDRVAEVGDLLFAVVNVARHLGVDPEAALRAGVTKFRARVEAVEGLAARDGVDLAAADLAVLDAYWDQAKSAEGGRSAGTSAS
jgi:tetrapyrrole methylase family protein/MazG family protein